MTSAKASDCSISASKFMSFSSFIEDIDVFDGVGDPGVSISTTTTLEVDCQVLVSRKGK